MRLTLRTLLSYLDNVLDEPARAELQRQIDASEHASEWVHRTRDVMRRLKLGAPEPAGTGSIDDPNTVAEYLDRTLPEEGVAEFERVCLESDAMLAEVASCHHVLAMFLSEPTEIDPDTRKRLHRLQDDLANALRSRIEKAHSVPGVAAATPVAAPAAETAPPRRVKPAVVAAAPATDGEGGSTWSDLAPWAPAIAALLLLATTAVLVLNSGDGSSLARKDAPKPTTTEQPDKPEPTPAEPPAVTTDSEEQPSDTPTEAEPTAQPTVAAEQAPAEGESPEAGGEAADAAQPAAETQPAPEPMPADEEPFTDEAEPAPTADPAMPADTQIADAASNGDATDVAAADAEPAEELNSVVFRGPPGGFVAFETIEGPWERLVPGLEMQSPERGHVVCMPTYRAMFELSHGVLIELVDQTDAVIDPDQPGIQLKHGHLVLTCLEGVEAPVEVGMQIDSVDYTVKLNPGATVAIAADRFFEPGRPLLEAPAPMVVIAHAVSGESSWTTSNGERTSAMPAPLFFVSGRLSGAPEGFRDPSWVDQLTPTAADEEAAPFLSATVLPGEPVGPQVYLLATADNRQEVRSLAARCSGALNRPEALVASFESEVQFRDWRRHLDALREIASRSVAGAEAVQKALIDKYGNVGGSAFFEIVQGFDPSQVGSDPESMESGVVGATLLPMLDSADLATRVLGSLALYELVEHRGAPYDPIESERRDRRNRAVTRLENYLQRGEMTVVAR